MESFPWDPREQRCLWVPPASWVSTARRAIPKQADRKISKSPSQLSTQGEPSDADAVTIILWRWSFLQAPVGTCPRCMGSTEPSSDFCRKSCSYSKQRGRWAERGQISVWLKSSCSLCSPTPVSLLPLCLSSIHLSPHSRRGESNRISGPCAYNPL